MKPSRFRLPGLVAVMLLTLTGCPTTDLDYEQEIAQARQDVEAERAEAQAYGPSDAKRAAAAEQAKRVAANRAAQQRALRAANAEALRRQQAQQARERERAQIQELFTQGWAAGCDQVAASPRESGELVSYEDCLELLEVTDVATLEDAEGFGAFMAEVAVAEQHGP